MKHIREYLSHEWQTLQEIHVELALDGVRLSDGAIVSLLNGKPGVLVRDGMVRRVPTPEEIDMVAT